MFETALPQALKNHYPSKRTINQNKHNSKQILISLSTFLNQLNKFL